MKISIIVAMSANRVIGKDNKLPWRIPEDLRRFKEITTGHPVIMGRKTYDSIGRALPNRLNIVVSRQKDLKIAGVEVVSSLEDAIRRAAAQPNTDEAMVIGGAEIYRQALPLADRLYLTEIHSEIEGDAYFPAVDPTQYREVDHEERAEPLAFSFRILDRIRK